MRASAYSTSSSRPVSVPPSAVAGAPAGVGLQPLLSSATAPLTSPAASCGSQAFCWASEPARRSASPTRTVPSHGPGTVAAPKARAMIAASSRPRPEAVVRLGDEDGEPALLADGRHSDVGHAVIGVVELADLGGAEPVAQVGPDRVLEGALLVGELELHLRSFTGEGRARARRRSCAGPAASRPRSCRSATTGPWSSAPRPTCPAGGPGPGRRCPSGPRRRR